MVPSFPSTSRPATPRLERKTQRSTQAAPLQWNSRKWRPHLARLEFRAIIDIQVIVTRCRSKHNRADPRCNATHQQNITEEGRQAHRTMKSKSEKASMRTPTKVEMAPWKTGWNICSRLRWTRVARSPRLVRKPCRGETCWLDTANGMARR